MQVHENWFGKLKVWQHKGATMEDIELQELEFYIGQKFYGVYPPEAAIWCNANNAMIVEKTEQQESEDDTVYVKYYEICAVPEPTAPTKEEVKQMRIEYRHTHIDNQTLERNRKQANGTWTEEDETAYLALDAEVTAWIEENLPYPTGPIIEQGV